MSTSPDFGNRFKAIRRLASGGMGEVWLAHDREFDLQVAAKTVIGSHTGDRAELLKQEFRVAKGLVHQGIVRVHELHETEAGTFYTAEYLEGGDLGQLRGGSLVDVVNIVAEIAEALQYAHSSGVVHRDLKCSNIILDDQGHPHIADFGIAGIADPGPGDLRLIGGGSGTNQSPQQTAGESPSPSDDIYALGTVVFDLITGSPPFSDLAMSEGQYGRTAPRLSSISSVPSELDNLVASMLSGRVSERPESMSEVGDRLKDVAAVITTTSPTTPNRAVVPIRVSAPPRAQQPRLASKSESRVHPHAQRGSRWSPPRTATTLAFVILGLVAVGVFVYLPDWVQKNSRIVVGEPAEDNGESIEESGLIEAEQEPAVEENDDGSMPQRVSAPAVPGGDPEVEDRSATKPSREQIAALPEPGNSPDRPVDRPPTTRPMTVPPRPASPGASESGRAFSKAMSDGLRGLDNRDFIAAEKSFQAALKLRPDSREATDGLARARQKVRLEAIERHGAKAKQLVDAERWREAEAEFRAVLEIDPTIRFAMVGQQQASQRADLSDRLDFHLANPDRMSSLKVLNEAINLLDRARNAVPDGPRIQQQISLLEQAVEVASTPIRIRLVSDNNTEVVVYRVGSLGKFEQHQLDLRPGSYTVVGSRDGYRDVRRVLKVGPGQSTEPVVVRCEEKI